MDNDILKQFGGNDVNNLNNILKNDEDSDDEIKTFQQSAYYSLENAVDVLKSNRDKFTVLSLNAQSIQAKFDKLSILISHLNDNNFQFSAICIQESWLADGHDACLINIPGYNLIQQGKQCCGHGGLIIYLKDIFSYKIRSLHDKSDLWEGLFIDITHETINNKITLGNIYRPPKHNNNNNTVSSFLKELQPVVHQLSRDSSSVIITGDFNINLLEVNVRLKFHEYFDLFVTNGFYPKITLPTRFSRKSGTLIDQIFCKHTDKTQNETSGIIYTQISDHLPCFSCLDLLVHKKKQPKLVKIYTNTDTALNNFRDEIEIQLSTTHFNGDLFHNPNSNYNTLEKLLIEAKNKHMPTKIIKANKHKHKLSPWMTQGLVKSIKYRDRLYKILKSTELNSNLYSERKINLNTYNNILQRNIRAAKKSYYSKQFDKYKNDIKSTWTTIKEILNRKKSASELPQYFLFDNQKITDEKEIANSFNKFFTDIGPSLSKEIKCNSQNSYQSYLKREVIHSFEFNTVVEKKRVRHHKYSETKI